MARSLASQLMSSYVMIQSSLFNIVQRQVQQTEDGNHDKQRLDYLKKRRKFEHSKEQTTQSKPARQLARVRKFAIFAYRVLMFVYAYEFIRYLIIDLISLEAFQDYQHLDCFLLGRFRFIGRTNKIASRILLTYIVVFAIFRYICMNTDRSFKLYSIEFMLYDYKDVLMNEIRYEMRTSSVQPDDKRQSMHDERCQSFFTSCESSASESRKKRQHFDCRLDNYHQVTNPVFYLKRDINATKSKGEVGQVFEKWILRPNRTSSSWLILAKFFHLTGYLTIFIPITVLAFMYRATGGSILSNLGFEMSYSTCVARIQAVQLKARNQTTENPVIPYANIYLAPKILAHQKRIDDIPAIIPIDWSYMQTISTYNAARTITDIVENFWLYSDFALSAMTCLSTMQSCSLDIILNAVEIRRRLDQLVEKMIQECYTRQEVDEYMSNILAMDTTRDISSSDQVHYVYWRMITNASIKLEEEISDIQAILADHFKLVQSYNRFVGFCLTLVLSVAFSTSATLAAWVGSTRSRAVEYEFSLCEIIFTFLALYSFSIAAITHSFNYQLFVPITRAMALDTNMATKMSWTTIMGYYSPIPLYCFTLAKSTEISWLFCLKFTAWIVSAYVVLATSIYLKYRKSSFS